jgi:TolB-like protein/Tfp pilus assembly protein PilF
MGIGYLVVSWLLIQIADTVFPHIGLPDTAITTVIITLAIGIVPVLVLSWFLEITAQGVQRDEDVVRDSSRTYAARRRLDFIIMGVMAVAIAYFVVDKFVFPVWPDSRMTGEALPERSIAVLPFENMSNDAENESFAIGIHDDLLTHISKIGSIKCISRTTVLRYRNSNKSIPEIAAELNVSTILEGGVQRVGDRVRINVQLIDAATDDHLWAETFDRELSVANIFSIQTDIATTIAESLRATLSPEDQRRLAILPTENLAAYEAYLLGKRRMEDRTVGALTEAGNYFQRAIDLDPEFALAWVGLGDSHRLRHLYRGVPFDQVLQLGDPLIESTISRALELDSELGEAYASLGAINRMRGDFAAAEESYRRAIELNPNYATTYHFYANMMRDQFGRPEDALALRRKAVELDPLSAVINKNIGIDLHVLGRFDESLTQFEKTIEINPNYADGYWHIGRHYWMVSGRLDAAARWFEKSLEINPGGIDNFARLAYVFLDLGDLEQAGYWLDRHDEKEPGNLLANVALQLLSLYKGDQASAVDYGRRTVVASVESWSSLSLKFNPFSRHSLSIMRDIEISEGRLGAARAIYADRYPELLGDPTPAIDHTNYGAAIDLALVFSMTGEQERANSLLARSLEHIQSMPRLGAIGHGISDAQIYAQQGNVEKALLALNEAVDAGWRFPWRYALQHNLNFAALRESPEYQSIIGELEADMTTQLAALLTTDRN